VSGHLNEIDQSELYDVVGIGFGPANLALAIAIHEHNKDISNPSLRVGAIFVEQQPCFGWHRGMLLDGTTMQVSFLKDLATMRNPATEFSFLKYLQAKDRLVDFINLKQFFPSRIEFHDYLEWAASKCGAQVLYGTRAIKVSAAGNTDNSPEISSFDVSTSAGPAQERPILRGRNIVFGVGLEPHLPPGVTPGKNVHHNQDLLRLATCATDKESVRFVVVGAGQSAAETVEYLHRTFPSAEVCAVFSRFGYSPADDSPFANRIFDPKSVDELYQAPGPVKDALAAYHRNTNYSVVDLELIEQLYKIAYQEKVCAFQRLRLFNASEVEEFCDDDGELRVTVRSLLSGERTCLVADKLIFATGYRPCSPSRFLGEIDGHCLKDTAGRYVVSRDYRLETNIKGDAGIYLQGNTEHSHGITSSLLSNLPIRTAEILRSILARRASSPLTRRVNSQRNRTYAEHVVP
jgi:L-ornithine N5-oxygenase